jgi:hypothetical protein
VTTDSIDFVEPEEGVMDSPTSEIIVGEKAVESIDNMEERVHLIARNGDG